MSEAAESNSSGKRGGLAVVFGIFLFGFALFHARPGMAATAYDNPFFVWLGTAGWFVATLGFVAAAYGLWRFPLLAPRWRILAGVGALSSIALLVSSAQWKMWPMIVIDAAVMSLVIDSKPQVASTKKRGFIKVILTAVVQLIGLAFLVYFSAVVLLRPWQQHWGATAAEIARKLPGDDRQSSRFHLIDHVVTVDAAPEDIWPWLAQLGQARAGFYSYDWLERLVGMPIHNTYEINPSWQHIEVGDYVRTYANRDAAMWRIGEIDRSRLLYLEGWGPFWIEPLNGKARLGIRTDPGSLSFWDGPIHVFVFEPVHFLMEEKMLRTIRELSENHARSAAGLAGN
jgi:hypothetical protein